MPPAKASRRNTDGGKPPKNAACSRFSERTPDGRRDVVSYIHDDQACRGCTCTLLLRCSSPEKNLGASDTITVEIFL
jgi:hypothetical protein